MSLYFVVAGITVINSLLSIKASCLAESKAINSCKLFVPLAFKFVLFKNCKDSEMLTVLK
ncbi:hypothetical protein [Polaribacter gochangensis]|uniref:hypothetical protein n=1 Tax=Polaribacter gochangensis TaxID=3252903 RepID=UPI0039047F2C